LPPVTRPVEPVQGGTTPGRAFHGIECVGRCIRTLSWPRRRWDPRPACQASHPRFEPEDSTRGQRAPYPSCSLRPRSPDCDAHRAVLGHVHACSIERIEDALPVCPLTKTPHPSDAWTASERVRPPLSGSPAPATPAFDHPTSTAPRRLDDLAPRDVDYAWALASASRRLSRKPAVEIVNFPYRFLQISWAPANPRRQTVVRHTSYVARLLYFRPANSYWSVPVRCLIGVGKFNPCSTRKATADEWMCWASAEATFTVPSPPRI
jgi:hypothetical protein